MNILATVLAVAISLISHVEPRVGTAHNSTGSAGMFGKGTEEMGQTIPAVLEPHGMNFWTPQTRDTELKCIAPYYYADSLLQGFRNSHWIVGGCTQDYGSMTLMVWRGVPRLQPEERASRFSHDDEVSTPAYYRTYLPDDGLTAEMTGTSRAAIFRFSYDKSKAENGGFIVVNPNSDEGEGYIKFDPVRQLIYGYNPVHRIYQGKGEAAGFAGHFVVDCSELDVFGFGVFDADSAYESKTEIANRRRIGAYIRFRISEKPTIITAASSFTDFPGALGNLTTEIPKKDFDAVRARLENIWEHHLGQISIKGSSDIEKDKFYSAIYRTSFLPRAMNDVDGRYPSFAAGTPIRQLPDSISVYYDDFSMWDTYRAQHPLLTLLHPSQSGEMMQSLVMKYEQGGWLPIFPCWNSYTAAMIGDHCIAAIADAYVKGVRNFDVSTAYKAMRQNAFQIPESIDDYRNGMGRRALQSYLEYGYVPLEDSVPYAYHEREQVSRTLEYAFDDFALAQMANALGLKADYKALKARASNYRNVIDPQTGYANGRYANGKFFNGSNPFTFAKYITEGAPCHYTWYVPHDQYGLMKLMGGREVYVEKLDSMFTHARYWHGNEPCHQVAWLFPFAGKPWLTQRYVRHIMATEYLQEPGGLSGNDDAGQMSAWYVFAAMGFYPVCPATPYYILGSPAFPRMEITLENGNRFTIIAQNASAENIYIRRAWLNGNPYDKSYITHSDIISGGTLVFEMGATPNYRFATDRSSLPPVVF